jgi:hypothetical protein
MSVGPNFDSSIRRIERTAIAVVGLRPLQVFLQAFEATLREQLETHSETRPRPAPVPVSGGAGRSSIVACVPLAAPDYHSPVSRGMTLTMAAHPLTVLN